MDTGFKLSSSMLLSLLLQKRRSCSKLPLGRWTDSEQENVKTRDARTPHDITAREAQD